MKLSNEWEMILENYLDFNKLNNFLLEMNTLYQIKTCYPKKENVFRSMQKTTPNNIKVVILGQDPYHTEGVADGLAFSCGNNKPQPSLKNIFTEIEKEYKKNMPQKYILDGWAEQGVLLLNTSLSVEKSIPNSHQNIGWEKLTLAIIKAVNDLDKNIVFLLWGNNAKQYKNFISNPKHKILESVHPSPLSVYRGFFGCNHFKLTNEFLINNKLEPIDWFLL